MKATGKLVPAVRRLTRRLLPARRVHHPICHDLRSWALSCRGADYAVMKPPRLITRPLPETIEPQVDSSFPPLCSYPAPERALVTVPGARIRGQAGLVILPNGEFAGELVATTREGRHVMVRDEPAYYEPLPASPRRMSGNYYSALGFGFNNYYHFTHDIVMRLMAVADLLPADVRLLVPEDVIPFHVDTLRLAGLERFEWIPFPRNETWELENLYVASPLWKTHMDTPEDFAAYRAAALQRYGATDAPPVRLFVSRRDAGHWRVTNEEEVRNFLEERGFRTVSPGRLSVAEQIELFSRADIVVGTGAGMTNTMFCPAGAGVLQLQEPNHVTHSFWTMAGALGLDYHYFLCEIVANPGGANVDIRVPIQKLQASLDRITVR